MHWYKPFTPESFNELTGLNAAENEAVYLRWVNTQLNYANFQQMQEINQSLKEIVDLLKEVEVHRTTS